MDVKLLEEKLTELFGEKDDEWKGALVFPGKKREKYYAVKSPTPNSLFIYKSKLEEHGMKLSLGKSSKITLSDLSYNLVMENLITPDEAPGCNLGTRDQLAVDAEKTPNLITGLAEFIHELANSGLENLKKNT